jgi:tetratricopeptide (TPR) repeat protein
MDGEGRVREHRGRSPGAAVGHQMYDLRLETKMDQIVQNSSLRNVRCPLFLVPLVLSVLTVAGLGTPVWSDPPEWPQPITVESAPANATRVEPGDDLLSVSRSASPGSTLVLAGGTHHGPLLVDGKPLTIRGELDIDGALATELRGGPEAQPAIVVKGGGRLTLIDIKLAPTEEDQISVFARGSEVRCVGVRWTGAKGYGVYAESSTIFLQRCRFDGMATLGAGAFEKSTLTALQCSFAQCAATGLHAQGGSSLASYGCTFEGMGDSSIILLGGGDLVVEQSSIKGSPGVAVVVEGAASARVLGSTFEGAGLAASISSGGDVLVARNNVRAESVDGAGGIAIRPSGPTVIENNRFVGVDEALSINGASDKPIVIRANNATGLARAGYSVAGSCPDVTFVDSTAIGFKAYGLLLTDGARSVVERCMFIARDAADVLQERTEGGTMAISVQGGATATLRDAIGIATGAALNFYETAPSATTIESGVLIGPILAGDDAPVRRDCARRAGVVLRDDTLQTAILRRASAVLEADDAGFDDALSALRDEIAAVNERADALSSLIVEVHDSAGVSLTVPFTLHAPEDTEFTDVIGGGSPAGGPAFVEPGRYWVVPFGRSSMARLASVGEEDTLRIESDRGEWLTLAREQGVDDAGSPARHLLIDLRLSDELIEATRWLRHESTVEYYDAMLRPGATPEALARARRVAMDILPGTFASPEGESDEERDRRRSEQRFGRIWGWRILSIAGEVEDVEALVDPMRAGLGVDEQGQIKNPTYRAWEPLARALARIEARDGALEDGMLESWLWSDEEAQRLAAAVQLRTLGLDTGDHEIRAALARYDGSAWELYDAAWAMLGDDDPETLEAMRGFLDLVEERVDERQLGAFAAAAPALLHLLAHGNEADRARVGAFPLGPANLWVMIVASPAPSEIIDELARRNSAMYVRLIPELMNDRLSEERAIWTSIGNRAVAQSEANAAVPAYTANQVFRNSLNTSRVLQSFAAPAELAVQFYGGFDVDAPVRPNTHPLASADIPWMLEPTMTEFIVGSWARNDTKHLHHLEAMPLDQIDAQIDALTSDGRSAPCAYEIFRTYYPVATRLYHHSWHRMPMGATSFPYVTRYTEDGSYGGGLSGVATVRAEWRDRTLRVLVHLDQQSYYNGIGELGGYIEREGDKTLWPHHRYTVDDARELIAGVRARRWGGDTVELEPVGTSADGTHIFAAELESDALAGLWIDVELRFLDQQPMVFTTPLAWGDQARRIRTERRAAEALAGAARESGPGSDGALMYARALLDAGRHEQAAAVFGAWAERQDPGEAPELWARVAELFESRDDVDGAIAVFDSGEATLPDNAGLIAARAQLLYRAERYAQAAKAAEHSLALDPNQLTVRYTLGVSHLLSGKPDRATEALAALPGTFAPRYVLTLRAASIALSDAPDTGAIEQTVEERLPAMREDDPEGAGLLEILLGDVDVEEVIESQGSGVDACAAHCLNGLRLLAAGQADAAQSAFRRAIASGRSSQLEHRIARTALANMEQIGSREQ